MGAAKQRVLVIDDHQDLAEPIVDALMEQGFLVDYAKNGAEAARKLEMFYDVVILDLMLPDMSGESILRFLRHQHPSPSPFVIVLSARTSTPDKLGLFRLGCDDYICKPFSLEELSERVRAVLRRNQVAKPDSPSAKDSEIKLDTRAYSFSYNEKSVSLTPKETAILEMFLRQPGEIVHRREILHSVWGLKEEPDTNFLGVHFSNLRRKLAKVGCEDAIETIRNSGFRFHAPDDA